MGFSMCGHLLKNGYKLYVNNRTASKADGLIEKGAIYCKEASEIAE